MSDPPAPAYRLVGQEIEAEPRVKPEPIRIGQKAGGDAEPRIDRKAEEILARRRRDLGHGRIEERPVGEVPFEALIDPIGRLRRRAPRRGSEGARGH